MERPIIDKKDLDAFVHAIDRFAAAVEAHDRSRDLLAQAQQVVVTEFAILSTLLTNGGVKITRKD